MLEFFKRKGKASFLMGGQWGSEGKGAAAAFVATHLAARNDSFDIVTTNAGAQAGHTSTHDGVTKVVFHLPTASLYPLMVSGGHHQPLTYLNAGSIIDPDGLFKELRDNPNVLDNFFVHPNAAIITPECREYEMRSDSQQTKIASTRKGVGQALAYKVLRSGVIAGEYFQRSVLEKHIRRIDLNDHMQRGASVLVEVPQGHSLSLDSAWYPHTTSRNCTVMQAMSDAGIHPHFYHQSMMVIRTFPIRVGNIHVEQTNPRADSLVGYSGGYYPDQREVTWGELGVQAEITTVTKRVRRVFTFSELQVAEAIAQTRPAVIYITFMDYLPNRELARTVVDKVRRLCKPVGSLRHDGPEILTQWGPTTKDVVPAEEI